MVAPDLTPEPPRVGWDQFVREFVWNPGEHVIVSGPAGTGKTTLGLWLVGKRRFVVVLAMKPVDPVLDQLQREGFVRIDDWPPPGCTNRERHEHDRRPGGKCLQRVILWPVTRQAKNRESARKVFQKALASIFEKEGRWTVYVDELLLASDPKWYDLGDELQRHWAQGRSLGISVVTNTQRPSRIPPMAYTQITHLFMMRTPDKRDAERLSEIGGMDRASTIKLLSELPRYDFVYRNTRTDQTLISRAPKKA